MRLWDVNRAESSVNTANVMRHRVSFDAPRLIRFVVSDETIWAEFQIPPHPPLAKGGNLRIVSIVTPNLIIFEIMAEKLTLLMGIL